MLSATLLVGAAVASALTVSPPALPLESLVGEYQLLESAVPAGLLEVRARSATPGSFELVFSIGRSEVMHRTVLYVMPTGAARQYRVVRWESDPALLEREAEAQLTEAGAVFTFWLPTPTGRTRVRETWQAQDGGDVIITTAIDDPRVPGGTALRTLTARRSR